MSWTRKDRAKFDRWTARVGRQAQARFYTATWTRHLVAPTGVVQRSGLWVPGSPRAFWLGEFPEERFGWMSYKPNDLAIREDRFVHPSWWHPSPAPRTRRQRKAGR